MVQKTLQYHKKRIFFKINYILKTTGIVGFRVIKVQNIVKLKSRRNTYLVMAGNNTISVQGRTYASARRRVFNVIKYKNKSYR